MTKVLVVKTIHSLFITTLLFCLFFIPIFANGAGMGLVWECTGGLAGECTFEDLINAVKHFTNQATIIALEICVVVIAWAGFKYMTSGGSPNGRAEANKILWSVVKGIAFIVAAWLIVTLILTALDVDTGGIF